jgi:O-antigen ligase
MAVFPPVDLLSLAVYAALGGVVLLATRLRPSNAIVALIATAPFDFSHAVGATTITFDKVALLAAVVGLGLRRPRVTIPRTIGISIFFVILATLLTFAVAEYKGPVLRETLKWIQYLLIFAVAAAAWQLDPDRRRLEGAVTLTVTAVAFLALAQEFIGSPTGIWFEGHPYPRIAGPLEGPNQLAGYLGIALPFLAVWALSRTSWITIAPTALAAVALVLTLSRSGIACGIVGVALVFFVQRRAKARVPLLIALAASLAIALKVLLSWHEGGVFERFFSFDEVQRSGGVGMRSTLWRAAYTLWTQHPILGVGAGNFELLLPTVGAVGIRTHANSWYLQSLVEGGLPLLFATCGLVWASIGTFRRALGNPICLAAFAAGIAFALHGFVDYLVFYPKVAIMWFALLGIAAQESRA